MNHRHTPHAGGLASFWAAGQVLDARVTSTAAGYLIRLYAGFYAISILSSLWVYFVARKLPPGRWRGLACAPVVLLQMAATPVLVDRLRTPVLIVPVSGILSLAAFKVAAYAMGRGPLSMQRCSWTQNLLQFGVVLSLPVIPKDAFKLGAGASLADVSSQPPATWATFVKLYGAKAGGAAVAASLAIWPVLPELLRHWFYALCLSLTLGALWDFWCLVALVFAGIPVAPSFDQPWLSTSFADYWSRRWNLTTAYLLRVLVYEPVREGRFVPAGSACNKPAATAVGTHAKAKPAASVAAAPAGPEDESALLGDDADIFRSGNTAADGICKPAVTSGSPVVVAADSSLSSSSSASNDSTPDSPTGSGSVASLGPGAAAEGWKASGATTAAAESSSAAAAPAKRKETATQALLRRVAATHATFFFSGLWHLLIFYYATGLVTHHWLVFFSVQAPIMVAETALKHFAKKAGFALPVPVAVFLTNFLLIVVAQPLFFGPCDWSGMCTAMMDNVKGSVV